MAQINNSHDTVGLPTYPSSCFDNELAVVTHSVIHKALFCVDPLTDSLISRGIILLEPITLN